MDYATTHPNQSVFVRVEWGNAAADFDLLWDAIPGSANLVIAAIREFP